MGVLDSFKQDAFLCSQTQDCTTREKKKNKPKTEPADGQCPGKTAGNHLVVVVETKGSPAAHIRPWRRRPGGLRRGQQGCAMYRHHWWHRYFVLFPFLMQQSQMRWERKRHIHHPTPRTVQQVSEICPSLLIDYGQKHIKVGESTTISRVLKSGLETFSER